MRQFFFDLLNNLYKMAGLRQLEKIYEEFPDKKDHTREINALLDELCKVCGMFSYIPEPDKQNIIRDNIYSDKDFKNLNGRTLFMWFDKVKGPYFARSEEQVKIPEDYKPLTGEERDKWIETYLKSVRAVMAPEKIESSGTRIKNNLTSITDTSEPTERYKPPSDEYVYERLMHIEWIKANFDPVTKEKLPGYVPEKEWIKINFK